MTATAKCPTWCEYEHQAGDRDDEHARGIGTVSLMQQFGAEEVYLRIYDDANDTVELLTPVVGPPGSAAGVFCLPRTC